VSFCRRHWLLPTASQSDNTMTATRPSLHSVRWTVCALLFTATTINYIWAFVEASSLTAPIWWFFLYLLATVQVLTPRLQPAEVPHA
jgi:hypothetical protein